ncbi:MAG: hypothetical protein V3R28_00235, partial [Desulfatiglandales bacterium]
RESLGMRRTYQYVAMTKDEAQRRRWTFYEAVNISLASTSWSATGGTSNPATLFAIRKSHHSNPERS